MSLPQLLDDANNFESLLHNTSNNDLLTLLALRKCDGILGPLVEEQLRRIVREKIELLIINLPTCMKCKYCGEQLSPPESRSLELKFLDKIPPQIISGRKIKGEGCCLVRVALVDCLTGEIVRSGCEASARLEIVALKGDPTGDVGDRKTDDNFNSMIVEAGKGKTSLLKGHTDLNLKEGICDIGEISFIHNSYYVANCTLCLGVRIKDNFLGTTIKSTKTEPFGLKDRRNTYYIKHYPPLLSDEVWRLDKIGRKGAVRDRLKGKNINTVEDFLKLLFTNPERLQEILLARPEKWKEITDHAKTCTIDRRVQVYYHPSEQRKNGVAFSVVGEVKGLFRESQYVSIDKLSEKEKADARKLVIYAFGHQDEIHSFNDEASLMVSHSRFPEPPGLQAPYGCNDRLPPMVNSLNCTLPGTLSHAVSSINCIGESSRSNGFCFQNDDFVEDFPCHGSDYPIYSPDHHFDDHGRQFLINTSNHQTENPVVSEGAAEQISPEILLVGSQDVSVTYKIHKRWRMVCIILTAIRRTISSQERIQLPKKQKVR